MHGFWNKDEQNYHINSLELLAAFFGLKCFAKSIQNCEILLRIDNTTAIAYINKFGGTRFEELNRLSKDIWEWCESKQIFIFASFISFENNNEADFESRKAEGETEYELSDLAFREIISKFTPPQIDLFASRSNTKCQKYVSWQKDPDALTVDSFTIK